MKIPLQAAFPKPISLLHTLVLLSIVISSSISSAQAQQMFVKLSSFGETVPYAVSRINALTFSGENGSDTLTIQLKIGLVVKYPLTDVETITFSVINVTDSILIQMPESTPRAYSISSISSFTFTDEATHTDLDHSNLAPAAAFSLGQNYPNPFNPSTTISFSLPERSFATLTIFDVMGRRVATLLSEELRAGSYSYHWDASKQSSGLYFYRLQAGSYAQTRRMLLLQ